MANEMTVRDFYEECKNYEYSNECFQLMKECAELELQQRYLLNEAHQIFGECGSEEYLVEAAKKDPEKTSNFVGKLKEYGAKAGNAIMKCLKAIGKILSKFFNFIKKLFTKVEKEKTITEQTVDILKKCKLSKEDAETLISICRDNAPSGIVYSEKQPVTRGINIPNELKDNAYYLYAALSTSYISISTSSSSFKTNGYHLVNSYGFRLFKTNTQKILNIIKKGKKMDLRITSDGNVEASKYHLASDIMGGRLFNVNAGALCNIDIDPEKIKETIDDLQELLNDINSVNDTLSSSGETVYNTDTVKALQYILTGNGIRPGLSTYVADYIECMTDIMNWRHIVTPKLFEAAKKISAAQHQSTESDNDKNVNESANIPGLDDLVAFMIG